jgi:hypothetical protein
MSMNSPDFTDAVWRKSTRSGDNGGEWGAFIAGVVDGGLGRL